MTALVAGCAETGRDGANESGAQGSSTASPLMLEDEVADDSVYMLATDVSLRHDYCCVAKSGNHVKSCTDAHLTKARTALECNATLTDNVVRDGVCSQYASCAGKIKDEPLSGDIHVALPPEVVNVPPQTTSTP